MKTTTVTIVFFYLFLGNTLQAQVLGLGWKYDKKPMFQAAFNAPVLFDKNIPYDVAFGLDYTTPNKEVPSGLQLQVTGMYFLDEGSSKSHLISAGLTAGYLIDFNQQFSNQFRLSPHLYAEFVLFVVKAGYDFLLPLQKATPFISVSLGGGYLFRHFKLM
ncbi:MAG TPA: hypothetical protein VKY33_06115 [Flavobacterium sp.]|nr:hypothetical protein [Flavobacterium sp.]